MFSYYAKWLFDFSLKIKLLIESNKNNVFPLSNELAKAFEMLKSELTSACLTCANEGLPFTVEYDASNHTLAASLIKVVALLLFIPGLFLPANVDTRLSKKKRRPSSMPYENGVLFYFLNAFN